MRDIKKNEDEEVEEEEIEQAQKKEGMLVKMLSNVFNIGKNHGPKNHQRAHENVGNKAGDIPQRTDYQIGRASCRERV